MIGRRVGGHPFSVFCFADLDTAWFFRPIRIRNFSQKRRAINLGLKHEGLGATEIAKRLKIGRASVYRVLTAGSADKQATNTRSADWKHRSDRPALRAAAGGLPRGA
jgi:hypothetical protein